MPAASAAGCERKAATTLARSLQFLIYPVYRTFAPAASTRNRPLLRLSANPGVAAYRAADRRSQARNPPVPRSDPGVLS